MTNPHQPQPPQGQHPQPSWQGAVGAPPPPPAGPTTALPRHPGQPTERARGGVGRWLIPVGTGILGLLVGIAAGGGGGDPTESPQYQTLEQEIASLEGEVADAEAAAEQAETDAEEAVADATAAAAADVEGQLADVETQKAALAESEAAVAAREAAVTGVEEMIAANSIGEGIWTVGVDMVPGTYRTAEPVAGDCYWGIYTSGTNGADIVQNDIVSGGNPTVTLREGQDFKNSDCGTFVLQP